MCLHDFLISQSKGLPFILNLLSTLVKILRQGRGQDGCLPNECSAGKYYISLGVYSPRYAKPAYLERTDNISRHSKHLTTSGSGGTSLRVAEWAHLGILVASQDAYSHCPSSLTVKLGGFSRTENKIA